VPRRLEIGPPRGDHLPRRQWREDGIRQPHRQARATADEEGLLALAEVLAAKEVSLDAVVPVVIDPAIDIRDPQRPGLELQGQRRWTCNVAAAMSSGRTPASCKAVARLIGNPLGIGASL